VFLGIFSICLLAVLCRFANKQGETLPNFGGLGASGTQKYLVPFLSHLKTCNFHFDPFYKDPKSPKETIVNKFAAVKSFATTSS
jgi:hypothetical protein